MQLRFKKICLLTTIFVYSASFILQSNLAFFQARAKMDDGITLEKIVVILVDSSIVNEIEGNDNKVGLKWYATNYIPNKTDAKALVIPLNLKNIHANDIYRMMENIYFDGLKNKNSQLIGLIMFGNIPLPVVSQDGFIFPTVYPYVDFESQKYIWDSESEYFVSNNNPLGQAEIWHGLINYGTSVKAYLNFFGKVKKYYDNPAEFIGDGIWYDDFIAQKGGFLNENYPYYRNRVMFAEDIGYQRYSPLMNKLFKGEQTDNSLSIVSGLEDALNKKGQNIEFTGRDKAKEVVDNGMEGMHTTKVLQQQTDTNFVANYNDMFSQIGSSIMRENIFAGGRWINEYVNGSGEKSLIVGSDGSASKMQLKDDLLLGNSDMEGLIQNLNDLMEDMIDRKIAKNKYDMDIVIPVSYENLQGKKFGILWWRRCVRFTSRFDNYYFGLNARNVDSAKDLSIYRGTYRNLLDLGGVTYNSLKKGYNPVVSNLDKTDVKLKSIGASYDIFSSQVEGNRGYSVFLVENDLDVYDQEKKNSKPKYKRVFRRKVQDIIWAEDCRDEDSSKACETPDVFGKRWRGGATPILLDSGSISEEGRYQLSSGVYKATNSWRSIFDMGGFQSLLPGNDEGMKGTGWVDGKGTGPQKAGTNFTAYRKYWSPTQREGWWNNGGKYYRYSNYTPDVHFEDPSILEYRNLGVDAIKNWKFEKETPSIFTITSAYSTSCKRHGMKMMGAKFTYKVISSLVKHTSTTDDEINGIDKNRYGEGGTLESYYIVIKNSYDNVEANVNSILSGMEKLKKEIVDQNTPIINEMDKLEEKVGELKSLFGEIKTQLTDVKDYLDKIDTLNREINSLENKINVNTSNIGTYSNEIEVLSGEIKVLKDKISNLDGRISSLNSEISNLTRRISLSTDEDEINGLTSQLNSKRAQLVSLQNERAGYQTSISVKNDAIQVKKSGITRMESQNSSYSDQIVQKKKEKENYQNDIKNDKIPNVKSNFARINALYEDICKILDKIMAIVIIGRKDISNVYNLIISLSADQIKGVMESVAREEGLYPENFYAGNNLNDDKIGFLSGWVATLKGYETRMKNGANNIIKIYELAYDTLKGRQNKWNSLNLPRSLAVIKNNISDISSQLNNIRNRSTFTELGTLVDEDYNKFQVTFKKVGDKLPVKVGEVSDKMDEIFVLLGMEELIVDEEDDPYLDDPFNTLGGEDSSDSSDDDETSPQESELKRDSARKIITQNQNAPCSAKSDDGNDDGGGSENNIGFLGTFDSKCGIIKMREWLIKVDTDVEKAFNAAMNDEYFWAWIKNNNIEQPDLSSWADWINLYIQWTRGPGYDSEGAKINHDLLLGMSEHTSGMNILTPDRPIDSPRYVTMQSVAGNEMIFIYPNLFKVEVYHVISSGNVNGVETHELLTGSQIKQNLIRYLSGKVEEYNAMIEKECNIAQVRVNSGLLNQPHYYRLNELEYYSAIPILTGDKGHGCEENARFTYKEFVDALGGEKMLDVIAETLYYQSLTNKKKLSSESIEKDIEYIKQSFSLNEKRRQVLDDYLVEGKEKIKDPIFEIPSYEILGYEVGYINSDGGDYIFPEREKSSTTSFDGYEVSADDFNFDRRQEDSQEKQLEDECNIPPSGKLKVFDVKSMSSPWFEGFKCWLKQTLNHPADVKITFDSSLGEILSYDSMEEYTNKSDSKSNYNNWGESRSKYLDKWDEQLDKGTGFDADKHITELQLQADMANNKIFLSNPELASKYKSIKISNNNVLLSDTNPTSNLRIESDVDIGLIQIDFISTGDGCIRLDTKSSDIMTATGSLCEKSKKTKYFNPKTHPLDIEISSDKHKAGKDALIMDISINGSGFRNIIKYTVSPSTLDKIDFTGAKTIVAGMMYPMTIVGYDKYNNEVSWTLEKYKFTASTGRFLKDGAYQNSFTTNDFGNLSFYYQAPLEAKDGSTAKIEIKSSTGRVVETYKVSILQAKPEIKMDGKSMFINGKFTDSAEIKLTNDESIYTGRKLNTGKLKKFEIEMKDSKGKLVNVDSQISITSQNGLLVIGQVTKDGSGNNVFFETSKVHMVNGKVTGYYYPSTIAGNDMINIDIPGLDTRVINLKVSPSETNKIQLKVDNGYVKLNGDVDFDIMTTDIWGNPTDDVVPVIYMPENVQFKGVTPGSELYHVINFNVKGGHLRTKIHGVSAGLTDIRFGKNKDVFTVEVDGHLLPESGLNIMYLNYFGNDWGNQWGYLSENKNHIESLMRKSNKILATTTLLASENKIKQVLWKIEPGFKITNYNNLDTQLFIKEENGDYVMNIQIGGVSMKQKISSEFRWLTGIDKIGQAGAIFLPNEGYSMDKKGVFSDADGEKLDIKNGEITLQFSDELYNGYNVWNVIDRSRNYGKLIFNYPDFKPSVGDFSNPGKSYVIGNVFSKGSTDNMDAVGIFDTSSEFEVPSKYKSIQNSDELDESIGFIGDFKNMTLFAEGEMVGEATRKFGSELLINLGDPLLTRKDNNDLVYGTRFDGGVGNEIFSDPEKDIFGVYKLDDDLLVVYLDGAFKLAKHNANSPQTDFRNMQELMRIAIHIQDVFVGDANGDGNSDIFVLTDNNQIRVYLNDNGKFDVDGRVVCLNQNVFSGEVSKTPSNLEGLNQFFVEDIDMDKSADIITYDAKGYIKVFFGGEKGEFTYLSKEKYACDEGWYDRQSGKNTSIVTALGVSLSGDNVYDNSMIHWEGLYKPDIEITTGNLSAFGIDLNTNDSYLTGLVKTADRGSAGDISDILTEVINNFDVDAASSKFIEEDGKYVDVTLYENRLLGFSTGNYTFIPISFLDSGNPNDYAIVHKNYKLNDRGKGLKILQDGDIVTVTVTIYATHYFRGAFGDVIQGPWNLYFDENNIFEGIKPVINWGSAEIKQRDGNFSYIIDNIELNTGENMIFSYELEYRHLPLKLMSIVYSGNDGKRPDIKLQSVDGCVKDYDLYPGGLRNFRLQKVPLQNQINKEYSREDAKTEDQATNVMNNGSDVSKLQGIVQDRINRVKLLGGNDVTVIQNDENGKSKLKDMLLQKVMDGDSTISLNVEQLGVNLSALEEKIDEINDVIDDMMQGMCNGFSFGGSNNCKGLPVPFNQAFLAPGQYHLFGCWNLPLGLLEGGLPIFFFPGTIYPIIPVPFPWGLKLEGADGFLWPGGGIYPSFIRIYAAPTLTAQLGVAVCLGPYQLGANIPSPFADLGGNCVVFAIKPQCKGGKTNADNPNEVYDDFVEDVKNSGVCLQSQKGAQVTKHGYRSSPFNLQSYEVNVKGGSSNNVEYNTSFLGIIELETSSYIGKDSDNNERNSIFIGDVDILGGKFSVNKIRLAIRKGIMEALVDKWLDAEIRYILNQLTKMHINVKLPDLTNLIGNEVESLKNISNNISTVLSNGDDEEKVRKTSAPMTNWDTINYDDFAKLNKSISNPFESLASLMNESNLINISVKTLNVKVPMIFQEDINAYQLYLQQWLEENEKIVKEWEEFFKGNNIEYNIGAEGWNRLQQQVYTNLMILQKYRNFPFEIYEWVHAIDTYVSELAGLINNTIGYLSYWTTVNAQRFVGYVDAIVLIMNIIKTYQILINFSTEWSQSCGSCTKDSYDQYTCKLSILCSMIDLPIIQIPNFKLPNITIDLTDIDLSLDIILPDFNFQPVRVELPKLINLPEPPSVGLNFDIKFPNIPLLPEPPELPELPSFIPEIELKLPLLPPAPELPKIPNEIESVLDIAKYIGKIYCIVKGKFGLVGEKSVKAKIEQLTQRTYEVKWIDTIMDLTNFSFAPIRSYGLDYEISSHVDLQFDFSLFYDYLDTLTNSINNLTTAPVNLLNNATNSLVNKENQLQSVIDSVEQGNINLGASLDLSMADTYDIDANIVGLESDDIEYVDYNAAKSRLEDVLAYFREKTIDTSMGDVIGGSISSVENQINRKNRIDSNIDGIEKVHDEVIGYLNDKKADYNGLADLINDDYDGFLAMVDSYSDNENVKSASKSGQLLAFNVRLFDIDSSTKNTINNITKLNPYESILDNKKTIIDGYWNAVNTNTASDLGLSQTQYLVLRDRISGMRNQIATLYSVTKPVSPTNLVAINSKVGTNKTLLAAEGARLGSDKIVNSVDPSLFAEGIYEKIVSGSNKGKLSKVVYSDSFASLIGNYYYHSPRGNEHNILLWSDKSVYLKCNGGSCTSGRGIKTKYYKSEVVVDKIPYKETWLEFEDLELKIADKNEEVKNWKAGGQTFDTISFSWKIEDVDGYLLKLVDRIDYSYEKADYISSDKSVSVVYALALPYGTEIKDEYKLELLNSQKLSKRKLSKINDLLENEESPLVEVVYYDPNKISDDITLSKIKRKWYYARIATLNFTGDTYHIDSPWSNQVVAGMQILGDDQPPFGTPTLYRESTKETVSTGDNLEGFVGTRYTLNVNWEDNVALSYISLSQNGKVLKEKYTSATGDKISYTLDVHEKKEIEKFNSLGIDLFGNKSEKVITVDYSIPEITITDIQKNSDGKSVAITAELSQDIDEGNVRFQRRRGEVWKTMNGNNGRIVSVELRPRMKYITGSAYSYGNQIALYDKDEKIVAFMDPQTAKIEKKDDNYEIKAKVDDKLVIQVWNEQTNTSIFSISLPVDELLKVEVDNTNYYKVNDLPQNGKMGMFNGGKVVVDNRDGNNILFISPTGYLYSADGLEGDYGYDVGQNAIVLTLYKISDSSKSNPIKVWIKVKPLEG